MYAGSVSANTMALIVRLNDTGDLTGPFTLTVGASSRVVKCTMSLV
jgi:hypothetical protein